MNAPVVGRLAPSPTGALHLGNARSFLLAWLSVRQQQGRIVLRIEDIDSPRVKPWAVQATLDDLRWLGIDWETGPDRTTEQLTELGNAAESPASPMAYLQTQRLPRYQQILSQLIDAGVVYRCTCTRSEVAQAASAPHESSLEGPIYPGTCRHRLQPASPMEGTGKFAWRWRFRPGVMKWHDGLQGAMQARPSEQLGDFVIARGDGTPAYQLAVVVDDHDMQVNEVVRGNDLIFSTYRQLAIIEHLGWRPPAYVHVPLMVGTDGRRLAKRHGDTRLSTFREQGIAAERLVGYLAWTLNLQDSPTPISAAELVGRLDWQRLPLNPTVVDLEQGNFLTHPDGRG